MIDSADLLIAADLLEDLASPACEILRGYVPEPRPLDPWELQPAPTDTAADHAIACYTALFKSELERLAVEAAKRTGGDRVTEDDVQFALQAIVVNHRGRMFVEAID